ncbi:hypothetical protein Ssi02_67540 [Sinosporangium siamense]|uniref:Uncharacterized protein n=1 Tax=Sinosporangium siamense TaxID=1367973 RepID=A0A919RML6_9ACTN|nr:hypothetical protein Ssi02_67540 [Sinosporangium siamense]
MNQRIRANATTDPPIAPSVFAAMSEVSHSRPRWGANAWTVSIATELTAPVAADIAGLLVISVRNRVNGMNNTTLSMPDSLRTPSQGEVTVQ